MTIADEILLLKPPPVEPDEDLDARAIADDGFYVGLQAAAELVRERLGEGFIGIDYGHHTPISSAFVAQPADGEIVVGGEGKDSQ